LDSNLTLIYNSDPLSIQHLCTAERYPLDYAFLAVHLLRGSLKRLILYIYTCCIDF